MRTLATLHRVLPTLLSLRNCVPIRSKAVVTIVSPMPIYSSAKMSQ